MTKKTIEKLPEICRIRCERSKSVLKTCVENSNKAVYVETRAKLRGYLDGLVDAGLITEAERRCLFLYYGTL